MLGYDFGYVTDLVDTKNGKNRFFYRCLARRRAGDACVLNITLTPRQTGETGFKFTWARGKHNSAVAVSNLRLTIMSEFF